ncbi:thiosulfate/3-mercaptopyruvate sulfurtransferase [Cohaesibacter sp. ES.047]|nr:thiosulfate/3-mercaptopyruvate sulfurtransferase [Cohaesibacter sp. ES.047]
MGERNKWLVDTEWLEAHLDSPDVVVVDGSWHMPAEERDPEAEYNAEHIPGSVFFDLDGIADLTTDLPHMLPTSEAFAKAVEQLGISNGKTIIIYDVAGIRTAPRIWWTFRIMGVEDVYILDGGLPKWKAEGRPVTDETTIITKGKFAARFDRGAVCNHAEMLRAIDIPDVEVVDARSNGRWRGTDPEPRPGLSSGRMPGSKNVPFVGLIDESGCLKDTEVMRQQFLDAGVDLSKRIITSCGSGVTAAVLTLALDTIGVKSLGLYDGSWTEWASREDSIIERD